MFGVVFDEANFVNAGGGDEGKMKKAMNIYRESANRKKSRFFVDLSTVVSIRCSQRS